MSMDNVGSELSYQPAQLKGSHGNLYRASPGLLYLNMAYAITLHQAYIGTASACEGKSVTALGLLASKIDGHVHNSVADLMAMVREMKNSHNSTANARIH
jgi:hypothetical protein